MSFGTEGRNYLMIEFNVDNLLQMTHVGKIKTQLCILKAGNFDMNNIWCQELEIYFDQFLAIFVFL